MRSPDQDVADGLRLATEPLDVVTIGVGVAATNLTSLGHIGSDPRIIVTTGLLTLDDADSLARVLQAWSTYRRRQLDAEAA